MNSTIDFIKHGLGRWIPFALAVLAPVAAFAYKSGDTSYNGYVNSQTYGGITWYMGAKTMGNNGTGSFPDAVTFRGCSYSDPATVASLSIPASLSWNSNGSAGSRVVPVTVVAAAAFRNCSHIKSVSIPISISTIQVPCFKGCSALTNIAADGREYVSEKGVLFKSYQKTKLVKYPEGKTETTYTVPSSVTVLADSCFANAKLSTIVFSGSPPSGDSTVFSGSGASVLYPQGASGWTSPWCGVNTYAIPQAVTGLQASQGTSQTKVTLTWTANAVATSYAVYRAESESGSKVSLGTTGSGTTVFSDANAIAGKTYYYWVKAVNGPAESPLGSCVQGWTAGSWTVTLDAQGGSGGTASVTATYGEAMPSIAVPSRPGYTFAGYYYYPSTGGTVTQYYTAAGTGTRTWDQTAATTLYAQWKPLTYPVALDAQEGSGGTASVTATYGEAMPGISVPTRTDYSFGGYYAEPGGGGTQYYTASGTSAHAWNQTAGATLYAMWTSNIYCTVTFDAQGGTGGTASVTATCGKAMPSIAVPSRPGHSFGGYYTETGGGGTQYYSAIGTGACNWDRTEDTVLYAKWTIIRDLYVDAAAGDDANDGTSWATAKASIQAAIDAANTGDTIHVNDGVYEPISVPSATANLSIVSVNGAEKTIIDGSLQWPCGVTNRCANLPSTASMSGFTLRNGICERGLGGGACGGRLENCLLERNSALKGGGAHGSTLVSCVVSNNSVSGYSVEVWVGGEVGFHSSRNYYGHGAGCCSSDLYDCRITGNSAGNSIVSLAYGGGTYRCNLYSCVVEGNTGTGAMSSRLFNCLVKDNICLFDYGGGLAESDADNCVIYGNTAHSGCGGVYKGTLNNCIVWNNISSSSTGHATTSTVFNCCCTDEGNPGDGNIAADPCFVDAANGDFRLRWDSPCIDAGTDAAVSTDTDLDGKPRIVGDRVDMGAYEYRLEADFGGLPLEWNTGGGQGWRREPDDYCTAGFCLRSGTIGAGTNSWLETTVTGPGVLSFDWRVSCNTRGHYAQFFADGTQQGRISGTTEWTRVELDLEEGTHALRWVYTKGSTSAEGEDLAALANVVWRPRLSLAVVSPTGNPVPGAGTHGIPYGETVEARCDAEIRSGNTRQVCTGWTGTGSVPADGTGAAVDFEMLEDSTLAWQWRTDYRIEVVASGAAESAFAGTWAAAGSTVVVEWSAPTACYRSISVGGDAQGVVLDEKARTLAIPADRPRTVTLDVSCIALGDALDAPELDWRTGEVSPWIPQKEVAASGDAAARSGAVLGDDTSWLETTVEGPGTLSWSWFMEMGGVCGIEAFVDGTSVEGIDRGGEWRTCRTEIPDAGKHTVRFEFWNAGMEGDIGDFGIIDQVLWKREVPVRTGIRVEWDGWGFLSGADVSQYVTEDPDAASLEWMLVYTERSEVSSPVLDALTGNVSVADGDEVLSVRRWEQGSTAVTVTDAVATSEPSDSPLEMEPEYVYLDGGELVYSNQEYRRNGGGIYALLVQRQHAGYVYWTATEVNTNIRWDNRTGVPDHVDFDMDGDVAINHYLGTLPVPIPPPLPEEKIDWGEDYWCEWGFCSESWMQDAWSNGDWHFDRKGEKHVAGIFSMANWMDGGIPVRLSVEPDDGTLGLSLQTLELVNDGFLRATFEVTLLKEPPDREQTYTIRAKPENGWDSITHEVTVGNLDVTWLYTVANGGSVVTGAVPARRDLVVPAELGGLPVTGIGESAFYECRTLTSVSVPDSVADIGHLAFFYCRGLTNAVFGNGVVHIGSSAFRECSSLASVIIPDSVTVIGAYAFSDCTGLTSAEIGTGVTNIGEKAFYGCAGLSTVTVPAGVASIGGGAFLGCSGLEAIRVESGNANYASKDGVLLDKGTATILQCPGGKKGEYVVPDGVAAIGESAFEGCKGLTAVAISGSVKSIGGWAFQRCSGLVTLAVPDGVERIEPWAFAYCKALTTLALPDSISFVGNDAFRDCSGLQTLSVPGAWEGTAMLSSASIPSGCTVVYRAGEEKPPVEVPAGWLLQNAPAFLAGCGGDCRAAANALAANGMPVWECYVAGLPATEATADFRVKSFSVVDGTPVVEWAPDLNEGGTKADRSYKLLGKRLLSEKNWEEVPEGADLDTEGWRFFRVLVELPQ